MTKPVIKEYMALYNEVGRISARLNFAMILASVGRTKSADKILTDCVIDLNDLRELFEVFLTILEEEISHPENEVNTVH